MAYCARALVSCEEIVIVCSARMTSTRYIIDFSMSRGTIGLLATLTLAGSRLAAQDTVRTVLLTAPPSELGKGYLAHAYDAHIRGHELSVQFPLDTELIVGHDVATMVSGKIMRGTKKVCLRFNLGRLYGDSVLALSSMLLPANFAADTRIEVNVAHNSWKWDGVASSATVAQPC